MTSFNDDELIAFVLSDLPGERQRAIARQAAADPDLSARIGLIRCLTGEPAPQSRRQFPGRLLSAVGGAAAAVACWAILSFLLPDKDGARGRGGQGAWKVVATLWTGQVPRPRVQAQTNRDPGVRRLFLLTSSEDGLAWATRINTRGVRPLPDVRWEGVEAMIPLVVPVAAPEAGVDAEWFVALVVSTDRDGRQERPPPERLDELSRTLTKALNELLPTVFQATTREQAIKLEESLAQQVKDAAGVEVRVAVRHWEVID